MIDQQKIIAQQTGGKKLGKVLTALLDMTQVGVTFLEIEAEAQRLIKLEGGTPSFQTVEDYKWATCLCVNDEVVHGIPTKYVIKDGDVVTVDVGIVYDGYHTDTAWTKLVGKPKNMEDKLEKETFLRIGEETLWAAISEARLGNHIGDISQAIQTGIEGAGYSIVKSLVGHTVGRELHEKPQIPGYLRGNIVSTPPLEEGMTIAIEIIYAAGDGDIRYANSDGWTISTRDGSLSACFEHSILITKDLPQVLTSWEK